MSSFSLDWIQLAYVSSATHHLAPEELEALLAKSRARNAASEVSGMLLYHEGSFMQVLEGPLPAVEATFERIGRDPRHRDVLVLLKRSIPQRTFEDWSMGFVMPDADEHEILDGYSTLLACTSGEAVAFGGQSRGHRLLASFRKHLR